MKVKKLVPYDVIVKAHLTSEDIFKNYFGDFITGGLYSSPLRVDKTPSFSFYRHDSGEILGKDFSTGKNYNGVTYVMELYNLNYIDALKKIAVDFGLDDCKFEPKPIVENTFVRPRNKISIKIQAKQFTKKDISYWESYGITYNTLKTFNVFSVGKLWIRKSAVFLKSDELCFAYYFPTSNNLKIYRPLSNKLDKWRSNCDNSTDIQGYWQVNPKETKPDLLILTSSMKEIMFLYEHGIKAMAIHGEGNEYPKGFIEHLQRHCKKIMSLKDWDEAGYKASKKLLDLYGIEPIEKPEGLTCKDVTDCWKTGQKEEVKQLIDKLNAYGKIELGTI